MSKTLFYLGVHAPLTNVKEPHVVQDLGKGDQENWLRYPKV